MVILKQPCHFTASGAYFPLQKGFENSTSHCINLGTFHSALFTHPHSLHYVMALYSSHPTCLTPYKKPRYTVEAQVSILFWRVTHCQKALRSCRCLSISCYHHKQRQHLLSRFSHAVKSQCKMKTMWGFRKGNYQGSNNDDIRSSFRNSMNKSGIKQANKWDLGR